MRRMVTALLLLLMSAVAISAPTFPETHFSTCPEMCCCKVCSDPDHVSYPYGTIVGMTVTGRSTGGPTNPTLEGDLGLCQVPTWSTGQPVYWDDDQNTATAEVPYSPLPDTIWWRNFDVFGDYEDHVAPLNCDCCRFSGIHTNCLFTAPPAARPTAFSIVGEAFAGNIVGISFSGGIEQHIDDIAEIRDSMMCGYDNPVAILRNTSLESLDASSTNSTNMLWDNIVLPEAGCYRLCYYMSQLTTPTWFDMGTFHVVNSTSAPVNYKLHEDDVFLEGSGVTIQMLFGDGYNIFDDSAEIHFSGTSCGSSSPVLSSTASGDLKLVPEPLYPWCNPEVVPSVSSDRPLRFLEVQYSDCPTENRLLVPTVYWKITLPAAGSYDLCYKKDGNWVDLGALIVPKVHPTVDALMELYDSTSGVSWVYNHGWGSDLPHCDWYGIVCDSSGAVTTISLARNELSGTIPVNFTRGDFSKVTLLNLERNSLSGSIPAEIGSWQSLRTLDLGFNNLQGTVPTSLQRCPIRALYLPENILDGELPYSLRSLVVVRSIWVEDTRYLTPLEVPQAQKYVEPAESVPLCPEEDWYCPVTGERSSGVTQCGYDGISEEVCESINCCWNAQDVSGKPCFTKKRMSYELYPTCTSPLCSPANSTV
eukprot:TRINITY_DN37081_c0_g1_i1.p1 TRINITY_DN37081_c0_g1~~TRINITY_DN37081_c0_g1_i1.p1  ORF type:complete len:646 (+),score=85.10 TRINITY_DN37081_c0_g1_i1:71-2008(+)